MAFTPPIASLNKFSRLKKNTGTLSSDIQKNDSISLVVHSFFSIRVSSESGIKVSCSCCNLFLRSPHKSSIHCEFQSWFCSAGLSRSCWYPFVIFPYVAVGDAHRLNQILPLVHFVPWCLAVVHPLRYPLRFFLGIGFDAVEWGSFCSCLQVNWKS